MKAVWYERQGPAQEVLHYGELPTPVPAPGEVRVRLRASAVNPADANRRAGRLHGMEFPRIIPNSDGAGIIDQVGDGVTRLKQGQRVWLFNGQRNGRAFGTAAEYIALAERLVTPLPDQLSFAQGATLGIPAMTAWCALFADGPIAGKTVLVTGGAGAVGHYAVQFAKWGGARVIATVSSAAKAEQARSVLRRALRHFTERDGKGLPDFLRLLADLPDGVSQLSKAYKMAQDMADTLHAAMDNDSLFGGSGVPVDPAVLFTPAAGKRARISVISFIGLKDDQQQQNFVNQLQMALFAWIKQHPAGDRPLGGLFVMDEAQNYAPSGSMTACTHSTLALVAQARKYGLGLIFATQAPKNLHNRIPGNSSSQFLGFLNSPIQIAAAKEIASAKSSAVLDISRLKAGQFYVGTEGVGFRKVRTPMCLSYHPPSAPTQEEVLAVVNEGR